MNGVYKTFIFVIFSPINLLAQYGEYNYVIFSTKRSFQES